MTLSPDDEFLADRYVLGLLEPAEQLEVEGRMARDDAFAACVETSVLRFAALDDAVAPVPLPEGAWSRLEQRLSSPHGPPAPAAPPRRTLDVAANVNRSPWRVAAALAAALALTLGLAWSLRPGPSGGASTDGAAVAVLLDSEGEPFALIEDFGDGEAALTALVAYEVPEGTSLQVWTKWSEEVGPVSLDVLEAFTSGAVGADGLPQPVAGQLYEITLEQEGGSATGRPTGPILGLGRASIPG